MRSSCLGETLAFCQWLIFKQAEDIINDVFLCFEVRIMSNKTLFKNSSKNADKQIDALKQLFEEIDTKQKEIADKKAKIREEQECGARITKHRFTV